MLCLLCRQRQSRTERGSKEAKESARGGIFGVEVRQAPQQGTVSSAQSPFHVRPRKVRVHGTRAATAQYGTRRARERRGKHETKRRSQRMFFFPSAALLRRWLSAGG